MSAQELTFTLRPFWIVKNLQVHFPDLKCNLIVIQLASIFTDAEMENRIMGLFLGETKKAGTTETRKFHSDYGQLLADGEIIEAGFVVLRDTFLFTNKRLILVDIQGVSGRQIEYLSIPYCNITKFSVQTGGSFDLNAELKIWIGSDTIPLEKKFNKDLSVYDVQKVLASHVLK